MKTIEIIDLTIENPQNHRCSPQVHSSNLTLVVPAILLVSAAMLCVYRQMTEVRPETRWGLRPWCWDPLLSRCGPLRGSQAVAAASASPNGRDKFLWRMW